jgi:hypothetical protein
LSRERAVDPLVDDDDDDDGDGDGDDGDDGDGDDGEEEEDPMRTWSSSKRRSGTDSKGQWRGQEAIANRL